MHRPYGRRYRRDMGGEFDLFIFCIFSFIRIMPFLHSGVVQKCKPVSHRCVVYRGTSLIRNHLPLGP